MKMILTALSLMLALGSVSSAQSTVAPAATQHRAGGPDVSVNPEHCNGCTDRTSSSSPRD